MIWAYRSSCVSPGCQSRLLSAPVGSCRLVRGGFPYPPERIPPGVVVRANGTIFIATGRRFELICDIGGELAVSGIDQP